MTDTEFKIYIHTMAKEARTCILKRQKAKGLALLDKLIDQLHFELYFDKDKTKNYG